MIKILDSNKIHQTYKNGNERCGAKVRKHQGKSLVSSNANFAKLE